MTGKLGAVGACPGSPLPQGACFPSLLLGTLRRGLSRRLSSRGWGQRTSEAGEPVRLGGGVRELTTPPGSPLLGQREPQVHFCWALCSSQNPQEVLSPRDGWGGTPTATPTPSSPSTNHSFHALADGGGTCSRPSRSLQAARAAGAPPREQPGTRLEKRKRKDRQKERKWEGESGRKQS